MTALPAALRLVVYDHLFPNKITLYTTPARLSVPDRFPNIDAISSLRLVCRTIKSEVDHHYAVIARQHYVALARSQGRDMSYFLVPMMFTQADAMNFKVSFAALEGLPGRHHYPVLVNLWS